MPGTSAARFQPALRLLPVLALLVVVPMTLVSACGGDPVAIPIDRSSDSEPAVVSEVAADSGPARILSPPLGPKPSVAADPSRVAAIREFLHDRGREVPCGSYRLWTDVVDTTLLVHLDALATRLDAEYAARLGLEPQGPIRDTVILFAGLRDFQRWEAANTESRGYAGHAAASEGLAVLHADRPLDDVLATTVHELAHLVSRRALGAPLPRWLSEGLADALGDSASTRGYLPLDGALGVEGEMRRLRSGISADAVGTLAALVSQGAGDFDRPQVGGTSYDYEHSALFVRFLLGQPDLAPRFRGHLRALAAGGRWNAGEFWSALDADPDGVEAEFRGWLGSL